MFCRFGCFVICLFLGSHSVVAGSIFQWKDDMGHVHFTDDQSKVPTKYLKGSAREMRSFQSEMPKPVMKGQNIYENMCAKCHVLGFDDDGRREALGWAIIDSTTKYPKEKKVLFDRLRYVVDGGIDMPVIDIGDDDLISLTDYFIEKLSP
ncbi:MAG: DUF4124 domain-containing protein [Mariprofundaceae bacterium]|nr:DUF4124 domain-containing protein [Mariprofundaceae bacterium]